jgi:hypothetical protein
LQVEPHVPALHVAEPLAGALQILLQVLQLFGSCAVSMQRESHLASPLAQSKSHCDATHFATPFVGLGHAPPQPPQLRAEILVSTQAPEQLVKPSSQAALQVPLEHTSPGPQAFVQAPQWDGSLLKSTH